VKEVTHDIEVHALCTFVYDQWTQFAEFPRFMEGVAEVRQEDDKRLRPGGSPRLAVGPVLADFVFLLGRCFDVDGGFSQFGQFFVRLFFFLKSLRKQFGSFLVVQHFRVGTSRAVACHFVVLDSLGRSPRS
jgi:hypothetical protein